MLRRTKQTTTGWKLAGGILLASVLFCVGWWGEVALAQLDLSVFQKEGASEEEQSKDRFECHTRAVQRTGFDPAIRPPDDLPPMRSKEKKEIEAQQSVEWRKQQLQYNDALKRCMTERGYTIIDH
ncbi:MAG: hypothetical protein ACWGSD_10485 [Thermodesulfobacteriota bacterium]